MATVIGDRIYFAADSCPTGTEPFVTDGTAAGTRQLADLAASNFSSAPFNFIGAGGQVLFTTYSTAVPGLFRTDGTPEGTELVSPITAINSICEGYCRLGIKEVAELNGKVLLIAMDAEHGRELWVSDGTAEGTELLIDLNPGPADAFQGFLTNRYLKAVNDRVYFAATNGSLGTELSVTDGTTAGTQMVQDRAPGSAEFYPEMLTVMGGHLYMAGNASVTQRGLYRMALPVGIDEADERKVGMRIAPNPSDGRCTLQLPKALQGAPVRWRSADATGRALIEGAWDEGAAAVAIDAPLPSGTYLLTVAATDGRAASAARMVVAR